jgi:nicotinamide mononucleotide transporter
MTAASTVLLVARRNTRLVRNRDVLDSLWIAAALTAASYLLGLALGWTTGVNWLEAFAVFTSYSCTYLCVRQRRFNYPIGALSTIAYCVLFLQEGLYASMVLNAYLTPILVYGWFRWRADAITRPVTRVEPRWVPVYLLVTAAAFAGAASLNTLLGGTFALADSVILVGTILAQFLMDNKKIESWFVWMIVNVVATWAYFSAGLAIAAVQYVLFLGNAVWAFVEWRRTMRVPL